MGFKAQYKSSSFRPPQLSFLILKFSKTTNDGILGELNGNSLNGVDERSTLNMSNTYRSEMIKL